MARWALVADRLWDGQSLVEGHAVVMEGGQISGIVSVGELPETVERVEISGTALPGLIDSHVHLADWMLPGFLAAGVTTVRDTGNDLEWIAERKRRTASDPRVGPAILCTGPLLDGPDVYWPLIGRSHADPAAVTRSVEELAESGVDAIKLYVNITRPQMFAAVEAATLFGLPVLAHLGGLTLRDALAAGVGELEHMSGCVHHVTGAGTHIQSADVGAESLLKAATLLCPTLVVWDRLARVNDLVFAHDRRREWVHPDVLAAWSLFPHRTTSAEERLARQASATSMKTAVLSLFRSGARIIAGSDTPWPNIVPGFGLHDELALLVDAGLSPVEALASATTAAAHALRVGDRVGRLAPGLSADVVVVEGNPLVDIHELANMKLVVRAGHVVPIEDLRTRTAELAATRSEDPVTRLIVGQSSLSPPG